VAAQSFYCIQCHKKYPTHQKLFDTLYNFSRTAPGECPACGGARDLHVSLDFQLGAGDTDYKVASTLLPERLESWMGEEQEKVTFYPFLVVLETNEGKQFCWMPYWHVTGNEARYGQHAVCLEQRQFEKPDGAGAGEASGTGAGSPILLTLGYRRPASRPCGTCAVR
jgi:hypothetical protein